MNVKLAIFFLAKFLGHTWGQLPPEKVVALARACETSQGFANRVKALSEKHFPDDQGLQCPHVDDAGNFAHSTASGRLMWGGYDECIAGVVNRPDGTVFSWDYVVAKDGHPPVWRVHPVAGAKFGMRHLEALNWVATALGVSPLAFAESVEGLISKAKAFDAAQAAEVEAEIEAEVT